MWQVGQDVGDVMGIRPACKFCNFEELESSVWYQFLISQ